jgi:hypothetical protein
MLQGQAQDLLTRVAHCHQVAGLQERDLLLDGRALHETVPLRVVIAGVMMAEYCAGR